MTDMISDSSGSSESSSGDDEVHNEPTKSISSTFPVSSVQFSDFLVLGEEFCFKTLTKIEKTVAILSKRDGRNSGKGVRGVWGRSPPRKRALFLY